MVSSNNLKYFFWLIIIAICLPYMQMILISLGVDTTVIIYIWIGVIVAIAFTFTVLPLREYKIHQKPAAGKEFQYGPIIWMNYTGSDKLLGVEKEITELKVDYTDTGLRVLKASKLYLRAKRDVLRKESNIDKENRQMVKIPEEQQELIEGLNIDITGTPMEQLSQLLSSLKLKLKVDEVEPEGDNKEEPSEVQEDSIKTEEQYIKSLQKPEANEITIEKTKDKLVSIKPEFLNLDELGITSDQQKEILKHSYIYLVHLYHPEFLDGYEFIEFSEAFYILPGPYKEILATRPMQVLDYDDYLIDVQGCNVMWTCLGFIKGKIPLLMLWASENLVRYQTAEVIKNHLMKNSTLYYLRIKIMEWIINQMGTEQDPFQQRIDALETQNEGLRDALDYQIQDYISDTFVKAPRSVQKRMYELNENLISAKKWKPLAIISLFIVIILMFIIFFAFLPYIGGEGITPPEEEAHLSWSILKLITQI